MCPVQATNAKRESPNPGPLYHARSVAQNAVAKPQHQRGACNFNTHDLRRHQFVAKATVLDEWVGFAQNAVGP